MPKLSLEAALALYAERSGAVTKKAQQLAVIRRYLAAGGTASDESLHAYLTALQREGYKPATLDYHRRMIRAFWRTLGVRPPQAALDFHPDQDSDRPAVSRGVVQRLLTAGETGALTPYQYALVILAALYGPREIELSRAQSRDIDPQNGRWYCRSAKRSQPRWLWIPPAFRGALDIAWPTVDVAHVERQFARIWAQADLGPKPLHVGWHALRRALTRDLAQAGVPDEAIAHFMRWRSGAHGQPMVALYKNPSRDVGLAGEENTMRPPEGSREEDAAVWEKHPCLGPIPS